MKTATDQVAKLSKGDQVTFINYGKEDQQTVVRIIGSEQQYNRQKKITGESNILVVGTPVFNLLNNAKLYKKITKKVSNKYIIKIKLLEVIKAEAKWYTITRLKQRLQAVVKSLTIKR